MADSDIDQLREACRRIGPDPRIRLVALFGSRARGDAGGSSDWDIGFLADPDFTADAFLAQLTEQLGTDRIDLVDLARASGQLRYRVAQDGKPVFARDSDGWVEFWTDAVAFWCDVGPVLRSAYAGLLQDLGR